MLRPRWSKVFRDLSLHKTRTLLVVLSIAVGVFAFGAVVAARDNILHELHDSYLSINPAGAIITTEPFDDELVEAVSRMEAVAQAEGRRTVPARIQIGPDEWYDLDLFVLPDDGQMTVNIVQPEAGAWPPPDHALLLERGALPRVNARIGDTVLVAIAGGEQRRIPIAGTTHDLSTVPAVIAGKAFGYINLDTLEWLGGTGYYDQIYNQMMIVVAEHPLDENHIRHVADQVAEKIERSGRTVDTTEVPTPQQHPAELVLPTILLILSGLGALALLLAMFLIINTIEAIMTRQVRQIGILKAVGTRNRIIMELYLGMVLIFGLLALLIAVPLGTLGALGFTRFVAGQMNVDIVNFSLPPYVLAFKVGAALLLPLGAAFPAIRASVRITVREALSAEGHGGGSGGNRSGRAGKITVLLSSLFSVFGRPLLLSLRNTFRRKWRLVRTLVVLTMGGAIFISVLTVRASLLHTLDETMATKQYDIEVRLARPYRSAYITQQALQVPGVVGAEGWHGAQAYPVRPDGSEGDSLNLYGLPATSDMLNLNIVQGRWLRPEDRHAIVLSSNFFGQEPLQVGDELVLKIDGEEYAWRIVGISQEFTSPVNPATGYVTDTGYAHVVGSVGHVEELRVATARHDPASLSQISRQLEAYTEERNIQVRLIRSTFADAAMLHERFNILTSVLSMMATLIGIVGGLGLMGTMSINVLERTKEIGIMRAIGASDGAVQQIVIVEGVLIGLIAWLLGTLVSLGMSRMMSIQIGLQLLDQPLSYSYASYAVLLWLGIVTVVAMLASYVPARNASRLTIREVLAYE
jgi:putative ABC transport system permease protein